MAAVEAHLRHELELSDYTTASIRNSGQVPEHLRATATQGRGGLRPDLAAACSMLRAPMAAPRRSRRRLAQLLVIGALNWSAEWCDPRRSSVDTVVSNAQVLVRNGLSPAPAAITCAKRSPRPQRVADRSARTGRRPR